MEIQQLSALNLKYLTALVLELWPGCSYNEEYETYKAIVDASNEKCYLVLEHGIYIAFIHLSKRTDYVEGATGSPVAYIEALYVKAGFQKTGIGRLLITLAENWGRENGCNEIASDTECNNAEAIAFHKKTGFEETNRLVCFIKKL